MDLGDILVVVGIIFAVLDRFMPYDRYHGHWDHGLLTLGVIAIGAGVLCQGIQVGNGTS